MSDENGGNHADNSKKLSRQIVYGILVFLVIALIIFITWLVLRATNPKFTLEDATVYAFNVSSPDCLITCNFQVTISSRNPNDNKGVYYDKLDIYATYRDQQITYRTAIPPTYEGHKGVDVWSPFVYGTAVPVAPYNSISLNNDQSNGVLPLMFKIDGWVRWKVGPFIFRRYGLHVKCPALINFGNDQSGVVIRGNVVKYQLGQSCIV